MRCVIADDSSIMRDRFEGYLVGLGHSVIGSAANARDAQKLCMALRPDLAVLDVLMPPGSGKDVALELATKKIVPRILIASSNSQEMVFAPLRAQGVSLITKPFSDRAFFEAVEALAHGNA